MLTSNQDLQIVKSNKKSEECFERAEMTGKCHYLEIQLSFRTAVLQFVIGELFFKVQFYCIDIHLSRIQGIGNIQCTV